MKTSLVFLTLLTTINAHASDPICKSQFVKNILTFEKIMPISGNTMELIREDLKRKITSLCNENNTSSEEKISSITATCYKSVAMIKDENTMYALREECELARGRSWDFLEGTKMNANCDKDSISNLSRKIKAISNETTAPPKTPEQTLVPK